MTDRLTYEAMDRLLIREPYFTFRRMHVHIDAIRIDVQKQHIGGMMAFGKQRPVSLHHRMEYGRVPDWTTIHEEILRRLGRARVNRIHHHTGERTAGHSAADLHRLVQKTGLVHLQDPLPIGRHR